MAASFLRVGRSCSLKSVLVGGRGTACQVPAAAFCVKAGDPKKPAKKTSIKKVKTSVDVGQFLQQRTRVEFPKKEVWGVPESPAQAGAKYTAAFQAVTPGADGSSPAVDSITHSIEPVVSTDAVAAEFRPATVPIGAASQGATEVLPADKGTVVVQAIPEASEAPQEVTVVADIATQAAPQVVTGEAVPDPTVDEALHEATPDIIAAEAVSPTVREAPAAEAAPEAPAAEAASKLAPEAALAEAAQEVAPRVAASDPIFEVIPELTQEGITAEADSETNPEVAVPEAVSAATPEAAVAEASIIEDVPKTLQEAEVAVGLIPEDASVEAVLEAALEVTTTITAPETAATVEEVMPTPIPEVLTAAAEVIPEAVEAVSSDEMVDPSPVLAEAAGAVESPEAQVDPIQKLFIDKIREYSAKSKSSGGLVDAGPEYERSLAEEVNRLQRLFGGGDLNNFPDFKFPEPKLEEVSK